MYSKLLSVKNNSLLMDSFWAILGNLSLRGLGLLGSIYIANQLGSELFGEFGAIKNTIVSMAIFTTFGLGYTATKFVADMVENSGEKIILFISKAIHITLFFSVLMALFMFFFSKVVADNILNAPNLSNLVRYVSIWVVFNAITTLQTGVISGFGEYKRMAIVNTLVGVLTFIITIIFTYLYKLEGAIFALILTQIVNYILFRYLLYKIVKKHKLKKSDGDGIGYSEILKFSFPIALQEIVFSLTSWSITILIITYSNHSELGIYTAVIQWSSIVLFIPVVLRNVILSNLAKEKDIKQHNTVLKYMLLVNLISTFLPIIFILIFSSFINQLYGESFQNLQRVLIVVLVSTIFISLNSVYSQAYMSKGKNWIMFVFRFMRDLLILIIGFVLLFKTSNQGAISFAYATLLSNCIFLIVMSSYYHKKLNKNV